MKLKLKVNLKLSGKLILTAGTVVDSDEDGVFPEYVQENMSLFEEVADSVVNNAPSASSHGVKAAPAPEKPAKPAKLTKPAAQTTAPVNKVIPVVEPAKAAKAAKTTKAAKTAKLVKHK